MMYIPLHPQSVSYIKEISPPFLRQQTYENLGLQKIMPLHIGISYLAYLQCVSFILQDFERLLQPDKK